MDSVTHLTETRTWLFMDQHQKDLIKLRGLEIVYGFPVEIVHLPVLFEYVKAETEVSGEPYRENKYTSAFEEAWRNAFLEFTRRIGAYAIFQQEDLLKLTRLVVLDREKKKTFSSGPANINTPEEIKATIVVANRLGYENVIERRSRTQMLAKHLSDLITGIEPEVWRTVE